MRRGIIGFSGFGEDSELCPPGQYGIPPVCVPLPDPVPTDPSATVCPDGSVGYPPYCYPMLDPNQLPGLPVPVPGVACPAGTTGTYPSCVPVQPPPAPQQPPPAPPAEVTKPSWWSQRSDAEKWLIVGVGVLGAVSLLALLRGATTPTYNENEGEPQLPPATPPEEKKAEAKANARRRRRRHPKA
jgi:hypothetical protein